MSKNKISIEDLVEDSLSIEQLLEKRIETVDEKFYRVNRDGKS